jgi:predicted esterase
MPFFYSIHGEKPKGGRSLFISMHGGGNAPKALNDSQYENQKKLYAPEEGVYLAPRAPTNTWNLWHEPHIDRMFARLIEDLIVFEDVDPTRVYLMGYSAGGDGVYQLAPRMADRFAAASMMAGHPNDASPLGLRNLPFAIHVGANDGGYKRNAVAREWGVKLDELRKADPEGYVHVVKLHAGKGHWMDREDAEAVPWMTQFTRNPLPTKVVWKQGATTHDRFYWLAVPNGTAKVGAEVVASYDGQAVTIEKVTGVERLIVRLDDRMLDLDKPVSIVGAGRTLWRGVAPRTVGVLARTLAERGDPAGVFAAEVEVRVPAGG